ncbi:hypothetical protein ACCO45_012712 [Purpureocillium lilacinum]|uniref:Uncharacterized protein n=1 Tax=Purpureocillium lilacinum TaxID=33203 RepID=A0ACC4DB03_PURLI
MDPSCDTHERHAGQVSIASTLNYHCTRPMQPNELFRPSGVSTSEKAAHAPISLHQQATRAVKRTRISSLLRTGTAMLKCDRLQPCGQCAKLSRSGQCVYAPWAIKKRTPPRGMSARLQRLEGMVRSMMEEGGDPGAPGEVAGETPPVKGSGSW